MVCLARLALQSVSTHSEAPNIRLAVRQLKDEMFLEGNELVRSPGCAR